MLGGLYDPAFGPMDPKEKCATCGLNNFECPGHFGHIEVSVPLYNPLVFMYVDLLAYFLIPTCRGVLINL